MTCVRNVDLPPYALGALPLADRAEVQRHVADCRDCRDELADMAGVLALLRRMPTDQSGPPEPEHETDRQAALTPTRQPWRRHRAGLAVGAASLLLLGATVIGIRASTSSGPSVDTAAVGTWSARDHTSAVAATAELREQPWGTTVDLTLRDLPPRLTCQLVVRAADGDRQSIGAWRTGYTNSISLPATTAYRLEDIAAMDVVTSHGDTLVSLHAPAGAARS